TGEGAPGVGEGPAVSLSPSDQRRGKASSGVGTATTSSAFGNQSAVAHCGEKPRRGHLDRSKTMSKTGLKLMLTGGFVASAFGVIALSVAWATPPKGLTQTLLAGPVTMDEMQVVYQTPAHGVMIKTRGLSDAYVAVNRIVPGGDTGWHSHPGPVFVLIT